MNAKRAGKALLFGVFLVVYYEFVKNTGIGVPCLFQYFFHLQCPGCGITHMILAVFEGQFYQAFQYHPIVFTGSPFLLWICGKRLWCWLWEKEVQWRKWEQVGMIFFVILLLVFAVLRSLNAF